jgi:methionyl-tRNA formyltransferase
MLLTGEAEAAVFGQLLQNHNPNLTIIPANNRNSLDNACDNVRPGTRLISFCSSVIVPKAHLDAIPCGTYNFHPGPPSYPGRYPSVFALYEEAGNFGVTVHVMAERVDEGPIIAAEWFTVPENCDLETLDTLAFKALMGLFRRLAKRLATDSEPLKPKMIRWSGKKWAKADCDALCRIDSSTSSTEAAKKIRACGVHLIRED